MLQIVVVIDTLNIILQINLVLTIQEKKLQLSKLNVIFELLKLNLYI
jgi:hypothetical protein